MAAAPGSPWWLPAVTSSGLIWLVGLPTARWERPSPCGILLRRSHLMLQNVKLWQKSRSQTDS
ncbi:hypothetical protein CPAR01_00234 [Colletotrichum paranaense]|uniref:Uncharacterized protein n=2 Tax=Colletotrichum acutatum species complex TaxID=2707335 RepID=A0AAI9U014_9PEZI|nr:uncharacterized protein CPAR01_00234 [Colletotrichum paranaense]KAK1449157.1 hypothetical protein CMEL01_08472 [Colletotrichum melonis]KAK1546267.1 hypothetical protein CPAR01_00234 [Colletotrichum paranaense]